ncbi:MAG: Hsp20/alpha crystallin family protein [Candidatus Muiribacteriaceae bacterium]
MNFERWDPTKDFYDITNFVRDIFSENNPVVTRNWTNTRRFPVDIYEQDNLIYLEAELPGVEKDDIDIALENGYLTISVGQQTEESGEKEQKENKTTVEENRNYYVKERKERIFSRTFEVGDGIDQEEIKAEYDNGILTLTFKRPQVQKEEVRKIKID